MWNTGFAKYFKEVLDAFLGKCHCEWSKDTGHYLFKMEENSEGDIGITLEETYGIERTTYASTMDYDALYEMLVPKHKMDYLYIFQDIMDELDDPNLQELSNGIHFEKLMHLISSVFFDKKEVMDKKVEVEDSKKIELEPEEIIERESVVNTVLFVDHNGTHYQQMALF